MKLKIVQVYGAFYLAPSLKGWEDGEKPSATAKYLAAGIKLAEAYHALTHPKVAPPGSKLYDKQISVFRAAADFDSARAALGEGGR